MKNFLKGIIVGIGGIAPGLSGSVLLVIFGLYQKTIDAIGTLFKNFKKNILCNKKKAEESMLDYRLRCLHQVLTGGGCG